MSNRTLALLLLLGLAALALVSANAQRAPWPSEVFDPPRRAHVAGEFDYYVLALSWSPTYCATAERGRDDTQCARADGLRHGFVLHGLWPQYEEGYPERCRTRWRPFVPDPVIDRMLDIMPSRGLVIYQYRMHGTCSGLQPAAYFALARQLYARVRIPRRYHNPFETQLVSPRDVIAEFLRANPGLGPDGIEVVCGGRDNRLREVRICMSKDGRPRSCGRSATRGALCRAGEMSVPPVRSTRREGEGFGARPPGPLPMPRIIGGPPSR